MTSIVIRQLSKIIGTEKVFEKFSFEVNESTQLVVLGVSGSGKTTLLRLIAGLETPDAGEILFDGESVSRPEWVLPPHRRQIGMVFQSPSLWPHMTVAENINYGLSNVSKAAATQRTLDLLGGLGLDGFSKRYPHELSGGEARRVALGRALAPGSKLLLMDEPLTNLNLELKEQILAVIKTHLEHYKPTLIYVTHDPQEAKSISNQVFRLAKRGDL